eukprot:GEMP01110395.1.p1 GENE.GEMP01110395.1~~GEMP01110395.1.p1  ORF type:complete len:101 (-),score=1.17 GEMP01110395.1:302-604(-)
MQGISYIKNIDKRSKFSPPPPPPPSVITATKKRKDCVYCGATTEYSVIYSHIMQDLMSAISRKKQKNDALRCMQNLNKFSRSSKKRKHGAVAYCAAPPTR